MHGYWIILNNSAGELDRKFVPITEPEEDDVLTNALVKFILGVSIWVDGDTIKIEEGWSEGGTE